MKSSASVGPRGTGRRDFLKAAGGAVAAAAAAPSAFGTNADTSAALQPNAPHAQAGGAMKPAAHARKIPIGVFDPVYADLSLDDMLDKVSALGLEAMEIGTGGYPGAPHCPVAELLGDDAKLKAWKKKFADRNLRVATLSCHGNPVHPDESVAKADAETFRQTVLLAEKLDVKVIVGFSGCPGGTPTDKTPAWVTYNWPPEHGAALEWQWKEKVIPYWQQAAKFARQHGVHKLALEMHPNFVVYNPKTLLQLREAVGEEIGANCDLSHLFWQGCDPVEVIRLLGGQGAIYHAHMKDTALYKNNVAKYGVLNFAFKLEELPEASANFRAVGYGHGAELWKEIVAAYMEIGYEGILSIENEDMELTGPVGVERAAYVLKNVRAELLGNGSAA